MKRRIVKKFINRMPQESINGKCFTRIHLDIVPQRVRFRFLRHLVRTGRLAVAEPS